MPSIQYMDNKSMYQLTDYSVLASIYASILAKHPILYIAYRKHYYRIHCTSPNRRRGTVHTKLDIHLTLTVNKLFILTVIDRLLNR